MPEPARAIATALRRDRSGIAVVYYPELGLRDWIAAQVESVAGPDAHPLRTESIDDAIATHDRLTIVTPTREVEAVLDLNARRDQVLDAKRTFPLVLMLLRGGSGQEALNRDAHSLWSVIRGSDPDPEELAEVDVEAERARFEATHAMSPEAWLDAYREERLPTDSDTLAAVYDAMLLERR